MFTLLQADKDSPLLPQREQEELGRAEVGPLAGQASQLAKVARGCALAPLCS